MAQGGGSPDDEGIDYEGDVERRRKLREALGPPKEGDAPPPPTGSPSPAPSPAPSPSASPAPPPTDPGGTGGAVGGGGPG
jgi:hypothetical protein